MLCCMNVLFLVGYSKLKKKDCDRVINQPILLKQILKMFLKAVYSKAKCPNLFYKLKHMLHSNDYRERLQNEGNIWKFTLGEVYILEFINLNKWAFLYIELLSRSSLVIAGWTKISMQLSLLHVGGLLSHQGIFAPSLHCSRLKSTSKSSRICLLPSHMAASHSAATLLAIPTNQA